MTKTITRTELRQLNMNENEVKKHGFAVVNHTVKKCLQCGATGVNEFCDESCALDYDEEN